MSNQAKARIEMKGTKHLFRHFDISNYKFEVWSL